MKFKPKKLQKRKYQRLTDPAIVAPVEPSQKRYSISRKKYMNLVRKAKASAKVREPELKYPTINPAVLRALRNSNVRFGNLQSDWIEQYKSQSVEYRGIFLKAALESMAQLEATRKASDNLIYDYGMPYGLDMSETVNMSMKVLSIRLLELFMKDLPENVRNKMLELHAEQLFSVAGRAPPSPYRMAPMNSPFKSASLPLDGFSSTPIAGQSLNEVPSVQPSVGRNLMPPRGLTL